MTSPFISDDLLLRELAAHGLIVCYLQPLLRHMSHSHRFKVRVDDFEYVVLFVTSEDKECV